MPMETSEMYTILQTCIIGNAIESTYGVSYDTEGSLDIYHLDDIMDEMDEDDNHRCEYHTPTKFLEEICGTNSKRVNQTIYKMEESWKSGRNLFHHTWQIPIGNVLWNMGKGAAIEYISEMFEESDVEDFINTGTFLFGDRK